MKQRKPPSDKCLCPDCEQTVNARGLCSGHYTYAATLVRTGKTTWDELIQFGKALPKGKGVRNQATWLLDFQNPKKGQKV